MESTFRARPCCTGSRGKWVAAVDGVTRHHASHTVLRKVGIKDTLKPCKYSFLAAGAATDPLHPYKNPVGSVVCACLVNKRWIDFLRCLASGRAGKIARTYSLGLTSPSHQALI